MKTIPGPLLAHIQSETPSLCTLWRIARSDGTVLAFTDSDIDVVYNDGNGSLTYAARTGYLRSNVDNSNTLSVDNVDVEGFVDDAALTDADIRNGKYLNAEVRVMLVNRESPTMGHVMVRRGRIGEITQRDDFYQAEMRGLTQYYTQRFVESLTPECRADLGDARCGVNTASFSQTVTVTAVPTAKRSFNATTVQADGYYAFGLLEWLTGGNAGAKMEIKSQVGGLWTLFLPMAVPIAIGDTATVIAGCNHTAAQCKAKFSNLLNFRGEPFVPGLDATLAYPNAKG